MEIAPGGQMEAILASYSPPTADDVAEIEVEVQRQLARPQEPLLKLLGYGGFSIAVAHPGAAPRWAFKRLPPGRAEPVQRYRALIDAYVTALEGRGLNILRSTTHLADAGKGRTALYIAQPILPPETLAPNALSAREPSDTDEILVAVLEAIGAGISPTVGVDGNFANWGWVDGKVWHFDISTPFLRDAAGKPQLDVTMMLQPYLVFARPYLSWSVAPQILAQYHDLPFALGEATGLLRKENLRAWIPAACAAANRLFGLSIRPEESEAAYDADRGLEQLAYRMRLAQRSLVQMTGGTYQFLMPPPPAMGD